MHQRRGIQEDRGRYHDDRDDRHRHRDARDDRRHHHESLHRHRDDEFKRRANEKQAAYSGIRFALSRRSELVCCELPFRWPFPFVRLGGLLLFTT